MGLGGELKRRGKILCALMPPVHSHEQKKKREREVALQLLPRRASRRVEEKRDAQLQQEYEVRVRIDSLCLFLIPALFFSRNNGGASRRSRCASSASWRRTGVATRSARNSGGF